MKKELLNVVNKKEDFICVVKLINDTCFDEEYIGGEKEDDMFI